MNYELSGTTPNSPGYPDGFICNRERTIAIPPVTTTDLQSFDSLSFGECAARASPTLLALASTAGPCCGNYRRSADLAHIDCHGQYQVRASL